MNINDPEITKFTLIIRDEIDKLAQAHRDSNMLHVLRSSSIIEDAARKIGWKALELEQKILYLAS